MMGVGKSTIGQELAHKLNLQFKDVDKITEENFLSQFKTYLRLKEKIFS